MPERTSLSISVPEMLLEGALGDKKVLQKLLSNGDEKDPLLDTISGHIAGFSKEETQEFLGIILKGLGDDNALWNADRRDGALELLRLVDLDKVDRYELIASYTSVVSKQNVYSDPYGPIYSLLEAGKILAPNFPNDGVSGVRVRNSWLDVAARFEESEQTFINLGLQEIIRRIPVVADLPAGLEANNLQRLGWREKPVLEDSEEELLTKYLEITKGGRTFKLALWDGSQGFRSLCQSHGIDLARFWNISDPDVVTEVIAGLKAEQNPWIFNLLTKAVKSETGIELGDLDADHLRVLSDEVVNSAEKVRRHILDRIPTLEDFQTTIQKFKMLLEQARAKKPPGRKQLVRQIENFFRQHDVEAKLPDMESVATALDDPNLIKQIELTFSKKQELHQQAALSLMKLFRLDSKPTQSLGSRKEEDLYLGDLTADCTAFHLNTGMNAWTVPVWLFNPGFNFFKISDGDKPIAKLGVLMALADGHPVLVADSFEVSKTIDDEERAKEAIIRGLKFLSEWSKSAGFERVFINPFSNSSSFPVFAGSLMTKTIANRPSSLELLGGLSTVAEARSNIIGVSRKERIYLQTDSKSEDIDWDETGALRWELLGDFEGLISKIVDKAKTQKEREKIEGFARGQDWPKLFKRLLKVDFPEIANSIGIEWEIYEGVIEDAVYVDNNVVLSHSLWNLLPTVEEETFTDEEEDVLAVAGDIDFEESLEKQARQMGVMPGNSAMMRDVYYGRQSKPAIELEMEDLEEVLEMIAKMRDVGLSPEDALKELYGQVEESHKGMEQGRLMLTPGLPILI